jgi:hypothetical protein
MRGYYVVLAIGLIVAPVLMGSCKKEDSQPTGATTPPGPTLSSVPAGVTVGSSQAKNVTITGGTYPYAVTQLPSANLATAQFVNANLDTAVLVITGVTTATGPTSVLVRDASTPQQKSVVVGILKVQ